MKLSKNRIDRVTMRLSWDDIIHLASNQHPEIIRHKAKLTHDYGGVEIIVEDVIPEPKLEPQLIIGDPKVAS